MEEDSLRFFIIPIIAFVVVVVLFSFNVDYKINTVIPNAIIEKAELNEMSCSEIIQKNSENNYWNKENEVIGKSKVLGCAPPKIQSTGGGPYVDFCNPGGFAPVKDISNNTHSFNHDTCEWNLK